MVEVGRAIAELLVAGGVQRFYCVPGESYLPILDGVQQHPGLRLISTRHESGAAFMAEADAKLTGRPAVAAGTRAVGAANLAIGVHTAFQDSTPMLVLLGQVETEFIGREAFQEIDLAAFYRPITKWSVTADRTDRIPELVSEALRIAQTGRPGPVMVAFPADVLDQDISHDQLAFGLRRASTPLPMPAASPEAVADVAKRLATASYPVIIAGAGAAHSRAQLVDVAERFRVGVYAAFRRQDVFPNDHELYLGHLGLGLDTARLAELRVADLVLVIGSRLDEVTTQSYTLPARTAEVVQVDVDAGVIGAGGPVSLGVVADARGFLGRLAAAAPATPPTRDWAAAHKVYRRSTQVGDSRSAGGIDPAQVIAAMSQVLPADAVIANDAGNFAAFLHQHWLYRSPHSQVAPANGAMGYGVPGAIGAKLAAPRRTVVGVAGDGGFSMTAMEIETAVREGIDLTLIVMSNGLQGTIAMHQARQLGRLTGVDIGPIDVAALARSLGAGGETVTSEADLTVAIEAAYRAPGVNVVDVRVDPEIIAPGARLSQLMAGQPDVALQTGPPG